MNSRVHNINYKTIVYSIFTLYPVPLLINMQQRFSRVLIKSISHQTHIVISVDSGIIIIYPAGIFCYLLV